ncbi:hypothetical protein DPEC_G00279860 [Dallia pectoralis]|uniref:Uncharacterized protein n=1 Tax=Dallia pectoralis TaxID=75939 RepID=A0ACC2FMJ3_DALPE|nr:hypothetical protein DPEC_G00279860 [Dallia pectoralis]
MNVVSTQEDPPDSGLSIRLADLIMMSHSPQNRALVGRSSGDSQSIQLARKRNKGEMFVGLMGRRSLRGESQEKWNKHQFH